MKLTVQDIYNFPELDKLTLIAGHGGLKNQVTHCGILDYEYDKDVSSKYYDYNYQVDGGFLTLTTFLYAKNDPNLIYDAVKKLVAKNGSGLIIKNIFKLPISDNVIRYANHMNFPIFILNDSYPFFEDIIVLISKAMEKYDSVYYREQKVTALLASDENDIAQISRLVYEINPSLQEELLTAYFKYESGYLSTQMYLRTEEKLYARGVIAPEDSIFLYKDGFLLIHSSRHFTIPDISKLLKPYFNALGDNLADDYVVGISKIHSVKEELGTAIRESLCAALFACEDGDFATTFDSLGLIRPSSLTATIRL